MNLNPGPDLPDADDPRVARLVSWLPESAAEAWQERAAIRQYDAGYTKHDAEVEALLDVLLSLGPPQTGEPSPRVFRLDTPNGSQWLLCSDAQRVADLGHELQAEAIVEDDPLDVLASQFGGLAVLGTV